MVEVGLVRRTSRRRAAALRAALEAKARRDAQRLERERQIEAALADFYEANGTAREIQDQARERAEKIMIDGQEKAQQAVTGAATAVRRLRELGATNAEIAELCQISPGLARTMANTAMANPAVNPAEFESSREPAKGTPHQPEAQQKQRAGPGGDIDAQPDTSGREAAEGPWPPGGSRAD